MIKHQTYPLNHGIDVLRTKLKDFGTSVEGAKWYGVARKVSIIRLGNRGASQQRNSVRFSLELARHQRSSGQIRGALARVQGS
jgi:hypothetical protein